MNRKGFTTISYQAKGHQMRTKEQQKYFKRYSIETPIITTRKIQSLADKRGISRNKMINIMIAEYFESHQE